MAVFTLLLVVSPVALKAQAEDVTIVPVYEAMERFADSARHVPPGADRQRLYERLVAEPFPGCARRLPRDNSAGPDEEPAALRSRVGQMDGAPALVREALGRARGAVSAPPVVVCLILARPNRVMRELGGVSGFAAPEGTMYLLVDPTTDGWTALLPFTTAHEYHHLAVFGRGPQPGAGTVMGRLTLEGKADVFASELYPGVRRPWHAPYTPGDQRRCWAALRDRLREPANTPEFTNDYLIAWTGRAPRFCGYAAGRRVVLRFLAGRPGLSPAEWITASPEELVGGVGREWP